jgi:hypothetical protein
MAGNLHATPAYITWDLGDTLAYLPAQSEELGRLLEEVGGTVTLRPVSGTLNPKTGAPAPHSWAVLDEQELFNVLAPLSAQRVPESFRAQLDGDGAVAFAHVLQRVPGQFTWLAGSVDTDAVLIEVRDVVNAREVAVSPAQTALAGVWPLRVQATSADGEGFVLRISGAGGAAGADGPPSYLVRSQGGALVEGVESDPATGSLLLTVPGGGSVDVLAFSVPWHTGLTLLPDPAEPGESVELRISSHPGAQLAWVIVGTSQQLMTLPGALEISVAPLPPALLVGIPLGATGQATLSAQLPASPALAGLSLVLQAVILDQSQVLADASNAFRFDIH